MTRPVSLVLATTLLAVTPFELAPLHDAGALAQQPQIPTLQVCNPTRVGGGGVVAIAGRADATHSGSFTLRIGVRCGPEQGQPYPSGGADLMLDLTDAFAGTISVTMLEQVTTTGRDTPTAYLNGRCVALHENGEPEPRLIPGCRFWLMVADNGPGREGTPDIVGFLVLDGAGRRAAYGTGPLVEGDISVAPTVF